MISNSSRPLTGCERAGTDSVTPCTIYVPLVLNSSLTAFAFRRGWKQAAVTEFLTRLSEALVLAGATPGFSPENEKILDTLLMQMNFDKKPSRKKKPSAQ